MWTYGLKIKKTTTNKKKTAVPSQGAPHWVSASPDYARRWSWYLKDHRPTVPSSPASIRWEVPAAYQTSWISSKRRYKVWRNSHFGHFRSFWIWTDTLTWRNNSRIDRIWKMICPKMSIRLCGQSERNELIYTMNSGCFTSNTKSRSAPANLLKMPMVESKESKIDLATANCPAMCYHHPSSITNNSQ